MDHVAAPIFALSLPAGGATLGLRGSIGAAEAAALRDACLPLAATGKDLRLDCAALEHLSGAALQVLLALHKQLASGGASLALVATSPEVAQILALAGASGLLPRD